MRNLIFIFLLACLLPVSIKAQTVTNNGDTITILNGTTLYIKGGLSNTDNGSRYPYIKNDGRLNLDGDLVKSPNMFYTGNDSLILSGGGDESIAGLNYGYISITGGGNKTLSGNASVRNKMVLSNGFLYTDAYRLTLDSTASLVEDSANHIIGETAMTKYLQMGVNETFGDIGLEIQPDSMSPGMTTVVRTTGSYLTGSGNNSVKRYFTVDPANNGNTGSAIVFHYFDGELNSLLEDYLAIYRQQGNSKWEYDSFLVRSNDFNTVHARVDSLGLFTAGSILNPLPVELISFTARLYNPYISLLNWQTASEINNDHFDIERSTDGKTFTRIGQKPGWGTTQNVHNYSYKDNFEMTSAPVLYYRLKQVDHNGSYAYSPVRAVTVGNKMTELQVWYNSSGDKTEVELFYNNETSAHIELLDIQGKPISRQDLSPAPGRTHLSFDMAGLAQGIYMLSVTDETGVHTKKVMKYSK